MKYKPKALFCDNQGAIALAKNPTHHAKSKHVNTRLHFMWDHVKCSTIELMFCPMEDMAMDIMTKGLGKKRHEKLVRLIGLEKSRPTTTPSPVEDDCLIRKVDPEAGKFDELKCSNTGITSGSVELRNSLVRTALPRLREGQPNSVN